MFRHIKDLGYCSKLVGCTGMLKFFLTGLELVLMPKGTRRSDLSGLASVLGENVWKGVK